MVNNKKQTMKIGLGRLWAAHATKSNNLGIELNFQNKFSGALF